MLRVLACGNHAEGRQGGPEWLTGEEAEAQDAMTAAERMRRDFEAERVRLQEQRKKGGHTAQPAVSVRHRIQLGVDLCPHASKLAGEEGGA